MSQEERAQAAMLASVRELQMDRRATVVPEPFPLEIAPNIFWIGSCLRLVTPEGEVHTGIWAYIIVGTESALMYDTGLPQSWDALEPMIDTCLNGRQLDYVVPSHPEYPHSGNLPSLLKKFPNAVALGDMRDYPLHYPEYSDRFRHAAPGAVVDLGGGYRVRMIDAVLRDMPNTIWAYEELQKVLFVADGFAYLHRDRIAEAETGIEIDVDQHLASQCGVVSDVGDDFPSLEDILHYCEKAFYWARFRQDSDLNFDRLHEVLSENPCKILAPSHGLVTLDLDRVVPLAREAHRKAYRGVPSA